MKHALRTAGQRFTARRMVEDYVRQCYVPAMRGERAATIRQPREALMAPAKRAPSTAPRKPRAKKVPPPVAAEAPAAAVDYPLTTHHW